MNTQAIEQKGDDMPVSYKPEVIADPSGKWDSNTLRFRTTEEAAEYVRDLAWRWTSVRDTRVVPSEDAVTAQWVDGRTVHLPTKQGAGQ